MRSHTFSPSLFFLPLSPRLPSPPPLRPPSPPPNIQSQLQTQSQLQHSNPLDSQINQRSQELSSIAQSITELADLFRDLGDMVVEQGTLLDSVEYNIETVGREMKGAVEELEQATVYRKNTGRRKCIFLLVLIIVGLVVSRSRPTEYRICLIWD